MSILGVNGALASAYQYANKTQKTGTSGVSFTEQLQKTGEAGASKVDAYTEYLKSKYGNVSIQSVGKDQASLDHVGRGMSGSDVIIAPNILEQMATNSEKAAYYEQKIDYYFDTVIPRGMAMCASQGLEFSSAGVVLHEDGTVTYITGCHDSPERVAKVLAIRKAKQEKQAEQREEQLERSQEAAEQRRLLMELYNQKQMMAEALQKQLSDSSSLYIVNQLQAVAPAVAAYENAISTISSSVIQSI